MLDPSVGFSGISNDLVFGSVGSELTILTAKDWCVEPVGFLNSGFPISGLSSRTRSHN